MATHIHLYSDKTKDLASPQFQEALGHLSKATAIFRSMTTSDPKTWNRESELAYVALHRLTNLLPALK